jgi:RP/EB family microtubule-associated protein
VIARTASRPAAATARAPLGAGGRASSTRSSSAAGGVDPAALEALNAQMSEMKLSVEGLEKERDFYFNKVSEPHKGIPSLRSLLCCLFPGPCMS